jgi:uncharacterized alpha-E superfamily protein
MLSRVAESIHWISRYLERAESVARVVDVNLQLMLDLPLGLASQWLPLVQITGDYPDYESRYNVATQETVTEFLVFDWENPNSIASCLRAARENARTIREIISSEMWEELNDFYLTVQNPTARDRARETPHEFVRSVRRSSHLLLGVTDSTLSHGEAWHFGRMGRLLERADKSSRVLDVKYFLLLPDVSDVGTPIDDLHWSAVLRSVSGFEMYRKRHGQVAPAKIAEFLLLDRDFPRSVHHCLINLSDSLHAITGTPPGQFRNPAERRLGQLAAELDYTTMDEVFGQGLHEYLDGLQVKLNSVGDSIFETFFEHRPLQQGPS